MNKFLKLFLMLYAEDDGTSGSGAATDTTADTTQTDTSTNTSDNTNTDIPDLSGGVSNDNNDTTSEGGGDTKDTEGDELPAYFSQLSKDRAEKYKGTLGKYKTLNDVADALSKMSESSKNSIKLPSKDATPEEIAEFKTSLGLPNKVEEYKLTLDKEHDDPMGKGLAAEVAKNALKTGMTQAQAQVALNQLIIFDSFKAKTEKVARENLVKTFDARMAKAYDSEYQVEADRDKAILADAQMANSFLKETGLTEMFTKNGELYQPTFIKAIAKYVKSKTAGSDGVDNHSSLGHKRNTGTATFNMSPEFQAAYGGKK